MSYSLTVDVNCEITISQRQISNKNSPYKATHAISL